MAVDLTGIGTAVSSVKDILGMFFPDKTEEEKAKIAQAFQTVQLIAKADENQTDINKVEAANPTLFISGWRPFIGWVCGGACAWNWIGISIAKTIASLAHYSIELAPASLTEMMPLLFALLGMAGYRTYEKVQGVAAK